MAKPGATRSRKSTPLLHMKTGIKLIAEERARQIKQEGWTAEHDRAHVSGELADAAICYALAAAKQARGCDLDYLQTMVIDVGFPWPWEDKWWKPSEDPRRNLIKAGALIAAELDRLNQ